MKDAKKIDALVKKIEKDYGPGTVIKLDSKNKVDVEVISTGLYSLDLATGVGGFPRGRIVEMYGPEGSGKTTLALNVVKQAQKAGGKAAYIDMENAIDVAYARDKIGVDMDDLLFSQPNGGEEALSLLETYVDSGLIDVVVVDSVASLVPTTEVEGDMGAQTIGLQARLMSHAMRKLVPIIKKSNTLVIFINQIRMKIGGSPYASPETTPGGKALPFAASLRLDIRRIAWIKEGDKTTGSKIRAKITKSKVAPPFKQAEFVLSFTKGLWREADLFDTAILYQIIKKEGNTYSFKDRKIAVGIGACYKELEKDIELYNNIEKELQVEDLQEPIKEVLEDVGGE
jgi:recombination protein RecA